MAKEPRKVELSDVAPGAWERFERAVDMVVESKPRPKSKADDKPIGKKGKSPAKPALRRHPKKKVT